MTLYSQKEDNDSETAETASPSSTNHHQDRLLSLLSYLGKLHADQNLPPCGLEATEKERDLVLTVLQEVLENNYDNHVLYSSSNTNQQPLNGKDLIGDWNLLYTSSKTMIINKSLSGLGRSTSDKARLSSIVQKLSGNPKFMGSVELVEHFSGVDGTNDAASFDVKVTGEWFILDNGAATLEIQPNRIDYVATTANAEDWASLGPIKRLDVVYLSESVMISRGSANPQSIFIWQRI
ncbi:MAG: hypothetical protein SGILL_000888 [Bacillariaceae sp.]